ncbi:MAG: MMPL family transporter [Acidiferrobacterales bacterium]
MTGLRSRLPLLLWLALVIVAMGLVFSQTRVATDLTLFLPRGADPLEQLVVGQVREGPASRVILIALEGAPSLTLARTSAALAQRLRASGLFTYVNNGDVPWSQRERNLLLDNRYLLSPGLASERFTVMALRKSLEERLHELASPLGVMEKQLLPRDPTGEFRRIVQAWAGEHRPAIEHGVWFSAGGKEALLVAQTRAAAFDLTAQTVAVLRIREAFASSSTGTSVELVLSGPAVFAVEARNRIRAEMWQLSIVAISLVTVFLLTIYRSARALLLIGMPLLTGVLIGVAVVSLIFGSIHAITLAFAATVIGVAVDYPIHLFSHRQAKEAASNAMARIWPTLRLSVLTTALGFTAMLFSGFSGLSQLGLLAVAGLVTAAAVTRWVLPTLVSSEVKPQRHAVSITAAVDQLRRLRWLSAAVIAAGLIYLIALGESPWETDIANLSPISGERKAVDQELRAKLGAADAQKSFVVFGDSTEDTLQRSERVTGALQDFVARRVLGGFDAPSRYLPSKATQQQRQAILPAGPALRRLLQEASRDLPFRDDVFEPFLIDIDAARASPLLGLKDFQKTSLGLRLGALLYPQGTNWVAILPLRGVTDDAVLTAWASSLNDARVHYLDLKAFSNQLVDRYRREALVLLAWGAGAIVLVLVLGLHSVVALLRVLLPVAAAVIGVTVLLLVLDQQLSLFHLVALLLLVGVGLDYGLFFNRAFQDAAERERTARALVVCNTTTVLVFGVLAFSQTPVLNAIGSTAAAGAMMCLVLAATLSRDPEISARPNSAGSSGVTTGLSAF